MNNETLAAIGRELFGTEWVTPTADILGTSRRFVERVASGKIAPVPEFVIAAIAAYIDDQAERVFAERLARLRALRKTAISVAAA